MSARVLAAALTTAWAADARAGRPDSGAGLFAFDESDVVEWLDGPAGDVRVHYSVSGPNATRLQDEDADGLPDFAQEAAATAEDVLAVFEAAGFRRPLREADVGLGDLGGSGAFDSYLVDFGGTGDGNFSVDGCAGTTCAGHMVMENDFRDYGYPSLSEAIRVLASHELFHAVQAAYRDSLDVWLSEGTAVWAENLYREGVRDFLRFASDYLADASRPLDRPPVGPVPAFAYATCLFWEHLSLRLGDSAIVSLLEATADLDGLDAVEAAVGAGGSTLREEWTHFGAANLATGPRAADDAFYPFAEDVDGLEAAGAAEGLLQDDVRFYPLATTYWTLAHEGGETWLATDEDPTGLVFSLHRARPDGTVDAQALAAIEPDSTAPALVADLPRGDYWIRGALPERAASSVRTAFCLGPEDDVRGCFAADGDAGADAAPEDPDAGGEPDGGAGSVPAPDEAGCGCRAPGTPAGLEVLIVPATGARTTRRRRPKEEER